MHLARGIFLVLVSALVVVTGLPQTYRRNKLSRQELSGIAKDAVVQTLTPDSPDVASAPTTSTVRVIIEGEVSSTPIPSGDDRKPPEPVVVLPGVNLTGFSIDQGPKAVQKPGGGAAFPQKATAAPVTTTTTAKPEEESDEDESDEEEEELGGPQTFGGGDQENAEDQDESAEDEEEDEEDQNDQENQEEEDEQEAARKAIAETKNKKVDKKSNKAPVAAAPKKSKAPAPTAAPKKSHKNVHEMTNAQRARVNSKAREEPFSLEISPDLHSFRQGGPPGKYDAFIPGYMMANGEVYVPLDTTDFQGPYTIVDDPGHQADNFFPVAHNNNNNYGAPKRSFRKQVPQKAVAYDDDDDSAADETSSQEDDEDSEEEDEAAPVRLSSFNILYPKKKKPAEEESEEQGAQGQYGPPPPGYRPTRPVAQVVGGSPGSDPNANQGLLINAASGIKSQNGEKPSLAYVPAKYPTGEDDEKDIARDPIPSKKSKNKNVGGPVQPLFSAAAPPSPPVSEEVSGELPPVPPPSSRADVFDFEMNSSEEAQPRSYYYPSYNSYNPYEFWYH